MAAQKIDVEQYVRVLRRRTLDYMDGKSGTGDLESDFALSKVVMNSNTNTTNKK